jgi:hypothetical protein
MGRMMEWRCKSSVRDVVFSARIGFVVSLDYVDDEYRYAIWKLLYSLESWNPGMICRQWQWQPRLFDLGATVYGILN